MTPQQKQIIEDSTTCVHIFDNDLFFVTRHGVNHYSANWLLQDEESTHRMGEFKTRGAAYLCIVQQFVIDHFDGSDVMFTLVEDTPEQYEQGLKLSDQTVNVIGALVDDVMKHEKDVLKNPSLT